MDAPGLDAVGEICRRLDGLPLAIELAAARTAVMSPLEIASRLDERFRLLTGGRRTAVERHQTLRATVEWSYALLGSVERTVFERLGVFAGSFDADAARAIVADDSVRDWEAFDALAGLVSKSLVVAEDHDGSTRYELLETLRQYARELLDENGEADTWRRRHAQYYCAFAERVGSLLVGPVEADARTTLRRELDNVRAAFTWSLDAPDPADVDLAVGVIVWLCDEATFDRTLGVGAWAERALERVDSTQRARGKVVMAAAAYEAFHRGQYDRAEHLALRSIEDGAADGCPRPCVGYYVLGMHHMLTGRIEESIALIPEMASEHDRVKAATYDRARMHSHACMWLTQGGRIEDARRHAEEAVGYARSAGAPTLIANSLYSYGASLASVDPAGALAAFDESIALGMLDTSAHWVASLYTSALLLVRAGRHAEALDRLQRSIVACLERGELPQLDGGFGYSVEILSELGQTEAVALLIGAIRGGALAHLRRMTVPKDRRPSDVTARARSALDPDARAAAMARGAAMSYDELVVWLLATLDTLVAESSPPPG